MALDPNEDDHRDPTDAVGSIDVPGRHIRVPIASHVEMSRRKACTETGSRSQTGGENINTGWKSSESLFFPINFKTLLPSSLHLDKGFWYKSIYPSAFPP